MTRVRRVGAFTLAAACLGLVACDALLTEPGTRTTEISLQFQVADAPVGGTAEAFSRIRRVSLRLVRPDSAFRDTVLAVTPGVDGNVRVALAVESDEQIPGLGLAARLGTVSDDLFQGGTVVAIVPGEPVRAEIPLAPIPAALQADRDSLLFQSVLDTVVVEAVALYATEDTVDGVLGLWTSADPAIVSVTPTGVAVALVPGTTVLRSRLDTLVDSVIVEVPVPPPPPVPETVTWLDPLGGNWSDGANWSRGAPPIAGDTVEITLAGTYSVVQDVVAPTLAELTLGNATGTQTLVTAAGPLDVAGGVTLTGGGALDVGDGGSLTTPAPLAVPTGSTLRLGDNVTVTTPSLTVADGATLDFGNLVTVAGPVVADGLVNVGGGRATISGTLTTSPTTTIRIGLDGTVSRLVVPAGFTNNGLIRSGGSGQVDVGTGTLLNAAGATIDVVVGPTTGDAEIVGTLNNLGTLTMAENLRLATPGATHANGGTWSIAPGGWLIVIDADALSNSGSLDAAGTLSLGFTGAGAGFANGGAVTLQSGGFLQVDIGPFSQPTGTISGAGVLRLAGVTASLPGPVTLGTDLPDFFQLEASTLTVPLVTVPSPRQLLLQDATLTGDVDLTGGALAAIGASTSTVTGALTTSATSRITVEGGSLGDPTLAVPTGYVNNGLTQFTSSQAGASATLQTPTLTNNLGGSITTGGSQPGLFRIVGSVNNQDTFLLQQDLTIQGAFTDQGTFSTQYVGNGSALNVEGLNIFNASFDNVRLVSVGGTLTDFSSVSFSNMDPTAVQVSITHPGSALAALSPVGLNFSTVPTTGAYFSLTDSDGGPTFLTVTVVSSTPLSGSALSQLFNGAILNW